MQKNKEIEALKVEIVGAWIDGAFVVGDHSDDHLHKWADEYFDENLKDIEKIIAEIEAAAVERAAEFAKDAARDWVFDQLDDEVLSALRDCKVIACKDGYLSSMKADIQVVVEIALKEWAENRRKEAQE